MLRILLLAIALSCLSTSLSFGAASIDSAAASGISVPEPKAAHSVVVSNVNSQFLQNGGSCVLASYAVVANYFTGRPVTSYFEGYCRHFGLSFNDAADAEQKYADHFDAEWRKRNCRGYEVILDLHTNSKEKCFAEARRIFEGRFYLDSAQNVSELERLLTTQESFLNITYEPGRDYHSITVMGDGAKFFARDTNRKGVYRLPGLRKIGKLRDSVLYFRK